MGVLLSDDLVWGPKQAISSAFFEDIQDLIKTKGRYNEIYDEIEDSIKFYTYTLDYSNKSREQSMLFFELVNVLIFSFDDIYKSRLDEEVIRVYKGSLFKLRETFLKKLCLDEKELWRKFVYQQKEIFMRPLKLMLCPRI